MSLLMMIIVFANSNFKFDDESRLNNTIPSTHAHVEVTAALLATTPNYLVAFYEHEFISMFNYVLCQFFLHIMIE
jgi:hypothetical protein